MNFSILFNSITNILDNGKITKIYSVSLGRLEESSSTNDNAQLSKLILLGTCKCDSNDCTTAAGEIGGGSSVVEGTEEEES